MNGTLVRTAKDHTLHAEWMEITSEKVEIVFVRDDMTKKDVEDFMRGTQVLSSISSSSRLTNQRD